MNITELNVFFVNFNNFEKYPFIKYCMDSNRKLFKAAKMQTITENNLTDYIEITPHIKWALDSNRYELACDEIRLQLLMKYDRALYMDMDMKPSITQIRTILDNPKTPVISKWGDTEINCSTNFLYSPSKDNPEIKLLFEKYQTCDEKDWYLCDVDFIKKHCPKEFINYESLHGWSSYNHSLLRMQVFENPNAECLYVLNDIKNLDKVKDKINLKNNNAVWVITDNIFYRKDIDGIALYSLKDIFFQIAFIDIIYQYKRTIPIVMLD